MTTFQAGHSDFACCKSLLAKFASRSSLLEMAFNMDFGLACLIKSSFFLHLHNRGKAKDNFTKDWEREKKGEPKLS